MIGFWIPRKSRIELPENATRFHYVDHTLCRNDSLKKREKKEETHVNSGNSEGNLTKRSVRSVCLEIVESRVIETNLPKCPQKVCGGFKASRPHQGRQTGRWLSTLGLFTFQLLLSTPPPPRFSLYGRRYSNHHLYMNPHKSSHLLSHSDPLCPWLTNHTQITLPQCFQLWDFDTSHQLRFIAQQNRLITDHVWTQTSTDPLLQLSAFLQPTTHRTQAGVQPWREPAFGHTEEMVAPPILSRHSSLNWEPLWLTFFV